MLDTNSLITTLHCQTGKHRGSSFPSKSSPPSCFTTMFSTRMHHHQPGARRCTSLHIRVHLLLHTRRIQPHTHNNTFADHGYALVQPPLLTCSILSASFTLSLVGKTPPSTLAPLFLLTLPPTPSPTGRGKLYRSILIVLMSFNRRPRRHTDPVQRLVRKRCGCVCVCVCGCV